jgi:rod shape determining protein RodA
MEHLMSESKEQMVGTGAMAHAPVLLVPGQAIREPGLMWSKILMGVMFILITIGMTNLYSAALGTNLFWSQLKNLGLACVAFYVCGWLISPRVYNTYAYWIFGAVCLLLVLVDIMGGISMGAQRWLKVGPIVFQPSELAKISVSIVVAKFFHTSRLANPYSLPDLLPLAMIVGVAFALIFAQPDLGTAGVCALITACQLGFVRINNKSLGIGAVSGLGLVLAAWFFVLRDYQKLRVLNLINPDMDRTGTGYNALQSFIAIGSGQFWGKGYMAGTQTQLQFLPARHTDFIFAVFSEEHGFLGTTILFVLFVTLIYMGLGIAKTGKDVFSSLLAVGMTGIIFVSFMINTSMVLGLFPVVGVPLPFFSYGGTAMIVFCASMGILIGIERESLDLFRKTSPFQIRSAASKKAKNRAAAR